MRSKVLLYCKRNGITEVGERDFIIADMSDGSGPCLSEWNLPIPRPTDSDLARITDAEVEAEQAAATAAAEQARINGLAWKYGGLVGALSAYLARVGWSIPCEAAEVTADLLKRDLGGQLTPDQKDAKSNVADTYMMLSGAGLSNEDIAAVWEKVKS